MIEVALVPSEDIGDVWHIAGPMLDRAVERSAGRYDIVNVLNDLLCGEQTLWLAIEDQKNIIGCCTVRIVRYPTMLTTLSYEYLAGSDISRWIEEGHRVLSKYAKEYGCTRLEVGQGRKGWLPYLQKLGYRQLAVRYECELEE